MICYQIPLHFPPCYCICNQIKIVVDNLGPVQLKNIQVAEEEEFIQQ